MRGGGDIVDGAVEREEDGQGGVRAVVEGELAVGEVEGAGLFLVSTIERETHTELKREELGDAGGRCMHTKNALIRAGRVHAGRYPQRIESRVMKYDSALERRSRPPRTRRMSSAEGQLEAGLEGRRGGGSMTTGAGMLSAAEGGCGALRARRLGALIVELVLFLVLA